LGILRLQNQIEEKPYDYRRHYGSKVQKHYPTHFCFVDDNLPRYSQAKLYPNELVTIGIQFALKGGFFRAFYHWLERDHGDWFGDGTLPERPRLQRLLKTHQDWCDLLMADPTFFTVMDSYPNELIFPICQGRGSQQALTDY
jgi:hypothetical protein